MNLKLIMFVSLLFTTANQAWSQFASTDDAQQPIEIEADRLSSQEQQGLTVYQGNVIIKQGTLTLKGDQVEVFHPQNKLDKIISTGEPAYFERYLHEQQSWIKGHANTLIYYAEPRKVELIGSAFIEQENTHQIQGDKLTYDLEKQTLNATSEHQDNRIKMTLTPQQTKPEEN